MADSLVIEHVPSSTLTAAVATAVRELCDAAYGEASDSLFAALGPGDHLLGRVGGTLTSHLMWVTRWLEPRGLPPLRTAYVEMVATAPQARGRGYATTLLERFPPLVADCELAALAPATEGLYTRLGWRFWRGPLSSRREGDLESTPGERVMILALPRTPPLDLDAPEQLPVPNWP